MAGASSLVWLERRFQMMVTAARWIGVGLALVLLVACGRLGAAGTGAASSATAGGVATTTPATTTAPTATPSPTVVPTATGLPAATPTAVATSVPATAAVSPTPFTVTAAPAWSALGAITPVWVQHGGFDQPIAGDPQDPRRVAYCAPDGIHYTPDGGATWTTIPMAGAAQAASRTAYPLMHSASQSGGGPPTCVAVTLDPDHPASFYATFAAYRQAAPPIYYVGYSTADDGRSWQAVPAAGGDDQGQFGGFQINGRAVQALRAAPVRFSGLPADGSPAPATPTSLAAEQTDDGGRTWHAVALDCPGAGPCLRFGPLASGIGSCAMHGYLQPILVSGDGGRTWGEAGWPAGSNACTDSELVSLSPSDVVLLAADAPYPLLLTRDGGRTWQALTLPAVPGSPDAAPSFSSLLMLPDGSLLAQAQGQAGWYALPMGGRAWCALPSSGLPPARAAVRVIGDRLWWLGASGPTGQSVAPRSVAVGSLRCGVGA